MKKVRVKSAIPLFGVAVLWLLTGLILPIYKLWVIIATAAASFASYFALRKAFPGREVEVQKKADSGDKEVDSQIENGRKLLKAIHDANVAIPDEVMSARIERMESSGAKIFDALEKDVSKANQVRRFMVYYLPTTEKLLNRYRELSAIGGKGENVSGTLKTIEDSAEMIALAFEKQLDALYKDEALDIGTDIDVLETMIKSEAASSTMTLGSMK